MRDELLRADFERAQQLYGMNDPELVGRFVLSQEEAQSLPINLDNLYGTVFERIAAEPDSAMNHANTFGVLNVGVALDAGSTRFTYDKIDSFRPPDVAEIATVVPRTLSDLFVAADVDAPISYVLANPPQGGTTVEIGLIQALHMVDTAMVTNKFDGVLPRIVRADEDQLLKLRADNPDEVFLRAYGDVRNRFDGLQLLGSVVSSSLLEASDIETKLLIPKAIDKIQSKEVIQVTQEREPAVFAGITIAKQPHLGHGLLLVKAISEGGGSKGLVIELNDRGPRVNAALAALAKNQEVDLDTVIQRVSDGSISFAETEQAYKQRDDTTAPQIKTPFRLASAERFYRDLLAKIKPDSIAMSLIADSQLGPMQETLSANAGYVELFDGAGMALLRNPDSQKALVIKKSGALTIPGILGSLSTNFALRLADSPPPLSAAERGIFGSAGLSIEQGIGMGIMFDFNLASGTKGDSESLANLVDMIVELTGDPKLLLPTLRIMLDNGYFLPSDGASTSLNFANKEAAIEAFIRAAEKVVTIDEPEAVLCRPMKMINIKQQIIKSIVSHDLAVGDFTAKTTLPEIRKIVNCFPSLKGKFSASLMDFVSLDTDAIGIPRNMFSDDDRKLVQQIRTSNADLLLPLLLEVARQEPERFATLAQESLLSPVMAAMGYELDQAEQFLEKATNVKGIFKLT